MLRSLLCLTCVALSIPTPSAAEDAGPVPDMSDAQRQVDAASERFRARDFVGALEHLRAAEPIARLHNDPSLATIAFNIARCLEELGRWEEALHAYHAYLEQPDSEHRKQRAWAAIKGIEPKVFGQLHVVCRPAAAQVFVDGVTTAPQACPWRGEQVRPGRYVVRAQAAGLGEQRQEVDVTAGAVTTADLNLEPLAATGAAGSETRSAKAPVWAWVALGVGAAAVGTGALLTTSALDQRDEAEKLVPGGKRDDAVDAYQTRETLSWLAYGVGAAGIATGVALFFVRKDAPTAGVSAGPNGLGVAW